MNGEFRKTRVGEPTMAASESTSMNKTLKTLATLGCGMVLLSFVVVVINQTAGVVQLAKEVQPGLGDRDALGSLDRLWRSDRRAGRDPDADAAAAWSLPLTDAGPEFDDHLRRLGQRLAINPRVQLRRHPADRIAGASTRRLQVLDAEANLIVKQMATAVFLDHGRLPERTARCIARLGRPIANGLAGGPSLLSEAVAAGDGLSLRQRGRHVVRRG